MINILRNKVSEYVAKNADFSSWESVREFYGAYSYLAFLCLAIRSIDKVKTWKDVKELAVNNKIENAELLSELSQFIQTEAFTSDFLKTIETKEKYDISSLYQEYLSIDFVVKGDSIVFDCGKNGRDVLGSYYTQYDFAEIISNKAIDDYILNNGNPNIINIVDYSCGSAIFLLAAINTCKKRNICVDIWGYDVDPIAVIISRVITRSAINDSQNIRVKILLGNPLLPPKSTCRDKFKKAIAGRYYNQDMGISPINNADIILGNPPWEKIRFEEKKFLHHFSPDNIVSTKSERERLIGLTSCINADYYSAISNDYTHSKLLIKKSSIFKDSCCGELNTYALFTELCRKMIKPRGIASLIIKSSLVKMPVYSDFFKGLVSSGELYGLYMFNNKNKIFNIDSREEFSVIFLSRENPKLLNVALNLTDYRSFITHDTISLTIQDLAKLNPETNMMPNIKNNNDLQFLLNLYNQNDTFGTVYSDCHYGRLVHLTNHSASISKSPQKGYSAIYEGKFIEQYTGKYASFGQMDEDMKYKNKASARLIANPQGTEYPESRYYIDDRTWKNISKSFHQGYVVAWRSLTSATNRRTMLATLLPLIPTCQSIQLLQLNDERQMLHILALFNSITFDYIVRLKMVGLDLTQTIIKQIPVPQINQYESTITYKGITASISTHILSRLKALYSDDKRIRGIFEKYSLYDIADNRKTIIADLDKIVGQLYGISQETLRSIANNFDSYYSEKEVASFF